MIISTYPRLPKFWPDQITKLHLIFSHHHIHTLAKINILIIFGILRICRGAGASGGRSSPLIATLWIVLVLLCSTQPPVHHFVSTAQCKL